MKLKEYVEKLQKMMEENPEICDFEVITAKDEEGNGYDVVFYDYPTKNYDIRNIATDTFLLNRKRHLLFDSRHS